MIGNSTVEYIVVIVSAGILHSIGPACFIYSLFIILCSSSSSINTTTTTTLLPQSILPILPRNIQYFVFAEAIFFVLTHVYLTCYLQLPAIQPLPLSEKERRKLFRLCIYHTRDLEDFFSRWFLGVPFSIIKRENAKEFFLWAFFNTDHLSDPDHNEELETYIDIIEEKLGKKFPPGKADIKCLRLTLDRVAALHRSLIWYMLVFVIDLLTHACMQALNFQFHRGSMKHSLAILPPRPHALVRSYRSTSRNLSYWYHPHTSKNEVPILFIHGIGVGILPYMDLLRRINSGRDKKKDGIIGIIAVELLCISCRLTQPMLRKDDFCCQLRGILQRHGFDKFVVVSHSYGTIITTHLLKTPDLASRISSVILVDPISILLNQPDVAYNFTARPPKSAIEWFLWYFGSRDIGVAHTLFRTFFWSENILWKEDILNHRCILFVGENDSVVNAARVVEYLQKEKENDDNDDNNNNNNNNSNANTTDMETDIINDNNTKQQKNLYLNQSHPTVIWCPNLNHGQIFASSTWTARLKTEILREAAISKTIQTKQKNQ